MTLRHLAAIALAVACPASAQKPAKPLFETSDVLRITIKGPLGNSGLGKNAPEQAFPAALTIGSEQLPITLEKRGLTRRRPDTCQFAPLRLRFPQKPAAASLFSGQKSLKLVTHCRSNDDFQQYVLLEYAAYRMFNRLTPASFRTRLAMIDYVGSDGRPIVSRYGFFIEDVDDLARRLGMQEAKVGDRIAVSQLSGDYAGRVAMFQHLLGNHDWSMRAGPAGTTCCHNAKLIGPLPRSTLLAPVPYDFDFSGFVGAPYAVPPTELQLQDVRERRYRGYCRDNLQAMATAREMRAAKADLLSIITTTPGLEARAQARATGYLERFFRDIASDDLVAGKVLKTCI